MTVWVSKGCSTRSSTCRSRSTATSRRETCAVPRRRRAAASTSAARASPDFNPSRRWAGGGRRRRHPADLRRADPGPVAGGGLVGAVVGRAQRRAVPAAARTPPGDPRCPTAARRRFPTTTRWPRFRALGGRRRAGDRGVGDRRRRPSSPAPGPCRPASTSRHFHRAIDTAWRRRPTRADPAAEERRREQRAGGHRGRRRGRRRPAVAGRPPRTCRRRWPTCRPGATFGSLVHAVLEHADPAFARPGRRAGDRRSASTRCGGRSTCADGRWPRRWCRCTTPAGSARPGLTLRQIGLRDRLRELDFEIRWPAAIGGRGAPDIGWPTSAPLLRAHLPADDPLAPYADRLTGDALGDQSLRGYLTGSIDVVLRVRGGPPVPGRRLQDQLARRPDRPLTAADYARDRWPRRCCTPTIRCRRCSTRGRCTGTCAGGCPATTPSAPRRRALPLPARHVRAGDAAWSTAHPAGCSAGGRRRRWSSALSDLLDGGDRGGPHDVFETERPRPAARPRRRPGCSREFNEAGVLEAADVHVAQPAHRARRRGDETRALAVALAVRAVAAARSASTCDGRRAGRGRRPAVAGRRRRRGWPRRGEPAAASPPVLRLRGRPCCSTSTATGARRSRSATTCSGRRGAAADEDAPAATGLDRLFPEGLRRAARRRPRPRWPSGRPCSPAGPAPARPPRWPRLLALLAEQGDERPAAAAHRAGRADRQGRGPAAGGGATRRSSRLDDADRERLAGLQAVTLHRLLGCRPDTSRGSGHHRDNRLPHDVVVVDETSMVSLTMMARLLEAVRPDARLVLVGDPDQLASVEAGAVLADLVDGSAGATQRRGAADLPPVRRVDRRAGARRCATGDADEVARGARGPAASRSSRRGRRADATRLREGGRPSALAAARGRRARRRGRGAGGARPAPAAVRPPRGPLRRRHWNRQVERWLTEDDR